MSAHRIQDHVCRRSEHVVGHVSVMNSGSSRSRKSPKVTQTLHHRWLDHLFFPAMRYEPRVGYLRRNFGADNLFSCSSEFIAFRSLLSTSSNGGYEKEAKVVITVRIEWSPGSIRILVDLGTNVEDTIKLILDKYTQEGRTPQLHKDAASSNCFDLHVSHFCLQSLDRSETIGAIGSRSFYLRRMNKERQLISRDNNRLHVTETRTLLGTSEDEFADEDNSRKRICPPAVVLLPLFISHKFSKIVRKLLGLFKLVDCLHLR